MVEEGGFGPHKFSRIEGGPSYVAEPRVSCLGSVGLDLFRQYDRGIFHQLSGRNSFLIPVSAGLGPVGMVSSEEYFSSRQFTFREKNTFWRIFFSKGKYFPSEWVLNHSVLQKICLASSPPPEIDLLNFRLPKYCSRWPDAQAWRIDALSFP